MAKSSLKLLEETLQTVKVIGENNAINVLQEAREAHNNTENPIHACIFAVIYKVFKITKKGLKYGNDRKGGLRANALHVCALLFSEYTQERSVEIARFLNKYKSDISRYMKRINTLNPNLSVDRELIDKIQSARKALDEKIEKINN